jgi:hypothetical protein
LCRHYFRDATQALARDCRRLIAERCSGTECMPSVAWKRSPRTAIFPIASACWCTIAGRRKWKLNDATHALCNAHLLHQLLFVKELTGHQRPQEMTDLLLGANPLCCAARRSGIGLSDVDIAVFRILYDAIVGVGEALHPEVELPIWTGGRAKHLVACKLLRRVRRRVDTTLLFICDLAVPFAIYQQRSRTSRANAEGETEDLGLLPNPRRHRQFCVIRS